MRSREIIPKYLHVLIPIYHDVTADKELLESFEKNVQADESL